MRPQKQNPGVQARASRDLLCVGWSQNFNTASQRQAQLLATRFRLSRWMAQDMARLCFGEEGSAND